MIESTRLARTAAAVLLAAASLLGAGIVAPLAAPAAAQAPGSAPPPPPPAWVERSNPNTQLLLEIDARFQPEGAGAFGVEGLDEQVLTLTPDRPDQYIAALRAAIPELEKRRAAETDTAAAQDLDILIQAARDGIEAI